MSTETERKSEPLTVAEVGMFAGAKELMEKGKQGQMM
jgi:hypothetical protein